MNSQVDRLIRLTTKNETHANSIRKMIDEMMRELPVEKLSPPEIAQMVYSVIAKNTGVEDPFSREKKNSNREAMELYPLFREFAERHEDRLSAAVKLAALGNIIDYAIHGHVPDADSIMREADSSSFTVDSLERFRAELAVAKSLFYILDNSGEIVLDRIMIETLKELYPSLAITAAVRSGPVINDVTLEDAVEVGLDSLVPVVTPGGEPLPGIPVTRGPEFDTLFRKSDIVLAKGQGNFESRGISRPVYHLFKIKCGVVSNMMKHPENSLIFYYRSGPEDEPR